MFPHSDWNLKKDIMFSLFFLFAVLTTSSGIPYEICWTKTNGDFKYGNPNCEKIFSWSQKHKEFLSLFNATFAHEHIYTRNVLRGKTIRVLADNMLPYITSSNYSHVLGGYLGDIWRLIETSLGFKSNVSSVYYDTGLQIIMSGQADVLLAAVVEKKGLLNVKYSQPYFYNWYHMFLKMPEAKASSSSYLKTFDGKLWIVSGVAYCVMTLSIWFTIKFINSFYRIEPYISIPSCFLGTTSGFLNQGFDLKLTTYSGRMQVMIAMIMGVILYSAMNAVLFAQLTLFEIPFPFLSLDDVADRRTHKLCLRTNSFVYNNFTDENHVIIPKWNGILNAPPCLDINNQSNLALILCNDNLVILENRVVMETILKNYQIPCSIINHNERLFGKANSFMMTKSLKHRKLIDKMVKRMRSTGILQRLEDKWVRRDKLININAPQSPQVTLDHIGGVLLMYSSMIVVSLALLGIEMAVFRYTKGAHPHFLK